MNLAEILRKFQENGCRLYEDTADEIDVPRSVDRLEYGKGYFVIPEINEHDLPEEGREPELFKVQPAYITHGGADVPLVWFRLTPEKMEVGDLIFTRDIQKRDLDAVLGTLRLSPTNPTYSVH